MDVNRDRLLFAIRIKGQWLWKGAGRTDDDRATSSTQMYIRIPNLIPHLHTPQPTPRLAVPLECRPSYCGRLVEFRLVFFERSGVWA